MSVIHHTWSHTSSLRHHGNTPGSLLRRLPVFCICFSALCIFFFAWSILSFASSFCSFASRICSSAKLVRHWHFLYVCPVQLRGQWKQNSPGHFFPVTLRWNIFECCKETSIIVYDLLPRTEIRRKRQRIQGRLLLLSFYALGAFSTRNRAVIEL